VARGCYIGKRRIENALAAGDVPVEDSTGGRSFSTTGVCQREGSGRDEYLTRNSARPRPTRASPGASSRLADEEGVVPPEIVKRQTNTTDCHG